MYFIFIKHRSNKKKRGKFFISLPLINRNIKRVSYFYYLLFIYLFIIKISKLLSYFVFSFSLIKIPKEFNCYFILKYKKERNKCFISFFFLNTKSQKERKKFPKTKRNSLKLL